MFAQAGSSVAAMTGSRAPMVAEPAATAGVAADAPVQVAVPSGMAMCAGSGPGAACPPASVAVAEIPGVSSLPDGMTLCPMPADKALPVTNAACSGTKLDSELAPNAAPVSAQQGISLSADNSIVSSGAQVVLVAAATASVSDIGGAVEIFDTTAGSLVGACGKGSRCVVAYAADGGTHAFQAFFTVPTTEVPVQGEALASNVVPVTWLKAGITADRLLAAPGQSVVVTATSAMDVQPGGRWLEIYDLTSRSRITYCTRGSVCATSITAMDGRTHKIIAYVTGTPDSVSPAISVTWLSVKLTATALTQSGAGPTYLQAAVDTDLAQTSWTLAIYDSNGTLIGHACNSGTTCTATTSANPASDVSYTAVVTGLAGGMATQPGRVEVRGDASGAPTVVVARSDSVRPTRALWGVDSCKAFTADPAGSTGLYPQVASMLGAPDFWGRYLTDTWCPGISQVEVQAAAYKHMGILPIYDDYDCSAVRSYATGLAYATAAAAAANRLAIPLGVGLAIDIEPPGPQCPGAGSVDSGFVEGWHDGITAAGYAPVYYGNGTAGSDFANAWCAAVADSAVVAADSYLWSFEPSYTANFNKRSAPGFGPYSPACDAPMAAWQYRISIGSTPDVDHDLAQASLPLWYPTATPDGRRMPLVGAY